MSTGRCLARATLAMVITMAAAARLHGQASLADSLAKLRLVSNFAFRAHIDSLHASTVPGIAASAHTIAVRSDASLQCPRAVGPTHGQPITVYVDDTTGLARNQVWWFFASGWVIGKEIAVHELARFPASYADTALQRMYLGPTGPRAQIVRRLLDTLFVVTGALRLDSVRPHINKNQDHANHGRAVSLVVADTLSVFGLVDPGSTMNVFMTDLAILYWPILQVPDAYGHLLFFLHTTVGAPDIPKVNDQRPAFMIRGSSDIAPITDSALVASVIDSLVRHKQPLLNPKSPDFVPVCGAIHP